MNLDDFSAIHVIGIRGAGCAPLARLLKRKGFAVSGSDLIDDAIAESLRKDGIPVAKGHDAANLPASRGLLVVRTSAAGGDNPEVAEAARRGVPCVRRGEALAMLARTCATPVCVSGSHGKTSISASLAFLLDRLGRNPGVLIGGRVPGWNRNGSPGDGGLFVAEADESDGTHALLSCALGIVPNVDDDHAWSVGGRTCLERNFQTFASNSKKLLYVASETTDRLFGNHPCAVRMTPDVPSGFLPGRGDFQRLDAWIALRAAELLGVSRAEAEAALAEFPGVDRRLSLRYDGAATVMEDYAHHPVELRESLRSLRTLHPGKRLIVVFQPHRYARLERYFNDFAEILTQADALFVLPVFAAWTSSGTRSAKDLAARAGGVALDGTWDAMADAVAAVLKKGDLVAVIGAGDSANLPPLLIRRIRRMEQ